ASATASASAAAGGSNAAGSDVHDGGRGQGHAGAQTSAHAGESHSDGLLTYVPFHPVAPTRRVVLAWRKSFTRVATVSVLRNAILELEQSGVTLLPDEKPTIH
ncbi:MAG TPA: hypothetical protein VEY69_17970, partial [Lautropia sp.]|nr:hypothetical protein [Lautropia sp.]